MFSWSKDKASGGSSVSSSQQYPGRRTVAGQPIAGSVRGPPDRAQHLESFLNDPTLKRSTRKVSSDDTTYDTVFKTTQGDTLILRVNVPLSSSMTTCPSMSMAGVKLSHDWVEPSRMRIIGYPPIQSEQAWKSSGLLLGKAVHAVVQQLQLNPPQIIEFTDQGLVSIQDNKHKHRLGSGTNSAPTSGNTSHQYQQQQHHHTPPRHSTPTRNTRRPSGAPPSYKDFTERHLKKAPPIPDVHMPAIPTSFSDQLDELSRDELDNLLSDELAFLQLVSRIPVVQEIEKVASKIIDENVAKAKENLAEEETMKKRQKEVEALQEDLVAKMDEYESVRARYDVICAPPDTDTVVAALRKASREAMDESESYADEWVENGNESVDNFVESFLAKRSLHHRRAAKIELLTGRAG